MLAGAYRLSKRQIQQIVGDLFGLRISTGMVSQLERQSAEALKAPYHEVATSVPEAEVVNGDETSWREHRRKVWPWATVAPWVTVFPIAAHRSRDVAMALLGTRDDQVVGSDRSSVYEYIAARWRQVCWSHLMRDFQAIIDRGSAGEGVGERLLALSKCLFRQWHRVRDGTLTWSAFQERMRRLRREVKQALEDGSTCRCAKTAATCFEILKVEEGLWTLARVQGVEPTNNLAERAMRHAVIWRKISGGTDRARGSRFVERMLTVVATWRQQGNNVQDRRTDWPGGNSGKVPALRFLGRPTRTAGTSNGRWLNPMLRRQPEPVLHWDQQASSQTLGRFANREANLACDDSMRGPSRLNCRSSILSMYRNLHGGSTVHACFSMTGQGAFREIG